MILALLLLIINVYIIINTKEPNKITEIKKRYRILREHLKKENIEKFQVITRELPISYFRQLDGNIGYNTDKGNEIGLCINHKQGFISIETITNKPNKIYTNQTGQFSIILEPSYKYIMVVYKQTPNRIFSEPLKF